ncbi:type II toxin-antitoxin system RelE/ParE family toxin [Zavarzinella formosa]|uniref:type II toxin-antitoxin system RelE/ParE family toxin n=1 Tax=Zavarzinella formosa TaxID=360055 RepID=UPI0002EE7B90
MSKPVILRPDATNDLREASESLNLIRAGLGSQFLGRVRELLSRIELMPELYGLVWQDVRAAKTKQFRHIVYYLVFPDRVEILAILHSSRDPTIWQSRL